MNYAWEAVLQRQSNPNAPPLSFVPAQIPSPYMEISQEDVNVLDSKLKTLEINGWYRFNHIFASLLNPEMEQYSAIRDFLFDVFLQWITQMDLRSGLYKQKYCSIFVEEDIQKAVFGEKSYEVFHMFSMPQQKTILIHMVKQYSQGTSISLLKSIMRNMFSNSMIYLDDGVDLLLYIGKKQTNKLQKQVDWLCSLFIPIDYNLHLFWDMHFGIIGVDATMEIDDIMIY